MLVCFSLLLHFIMNGTCWLVMKKIKSSSNTDTTTEAFYNGFEVPLLLKYNNNDDNDLHSLFTCFLTF